MTFLHSHVDARILGFLLGASVLLLPGEGVAQANEEPVEDAGILAAPAEFLHSLRLPGLEDAIRRPTAVYVDHAHGEVFIADSSVNRVVIFDRDGLYRYEFSLTDQVGSVVALAVDSEGFVYVLGTSAEGRRLLRFDFDGVFLSDVSIEGVDFRAIETMTVDDQDRIVVIDVRGVCTVASAGGEPVLRIDTSRQVTEVNEREIVRGIPRATGGLLYLPLSTVGTIAVFDLENGERLTPIGFPGHTVGQLNFPVAVDVLPSGIVVVLDKMRFNVQCYSPAGRFLGEFGGKGYRDGWMYHPTLLAAVSEDQVLVGQIMDHRIQQLRVPDFVFDRLSREPNSEPQLGMNVTTDGGPEFDPRSP
jgi:hypothetical protein